MKKFRILIVLAGVALIAYPTVGKFYAEKKQKLMYENLYNTTNIVEGADAISLASNEYEELQRVFEDSNSNQNNLSTLENTPGGISEQEKQPNSSKAEPTPASEPGKVMGRMLIDKINIDIPIVEGVSPENLEVSLGHLPGSSLIGEVGNTVIAGHRSHSYGFYFNRLDELEVNDEVIIDTGVRTYRYIVYQKRVVEPTDVSVLKRSRSQSILTLITCHPLYSSKQRLIVHAYLVN